MELDLVVVIQGGWDGEWLVVDENVVVVNYEMIFEPKSGDENVSHVHETHRMRYLFLPEIEYFLNEAGLRMVGSGKWMSEEGLGNDSWYGWVAAEHDHF